MARAPRSDAPDTWHHVMNRGSGRRSVFADDRDRRFFLALLGEMTDRHEVETHSFCLMGNHFHLLVRSSGGLSAAMQFLSANYTRAVNKRRGVDGPIFRSRFLSVLVATHEQRLVTCRYIERNPIEFLPADQLHRFRWSSLGVHVGERDAPGWLRVGEVRSWFDDDPELLRRFVLRDDDQDPPVPLAGIEVVGSRATTSPDRDDAPAGVDRGVGPPVPPTDMADALRRAVAAGFGCTVGSLVGRAGSKNPARLALALLAHDVGLTPPDVARLLDISPSSVRSTLSRARRRIDLDPEYAAALGRARDLLPAPPDCLPRSA